MGNHLEGKEMKPISYLILAEMSLASLFIKYLILLYIIDKNKTFIGFIDETPLGIVFHKHPSRVDLNIFFFKIVKFTYKCQLV